MLTLGPSDLVTWAGVTSLEPEQTWVPSLECLGFEGASKICLAMSPLPKDLENLQLCGVEGGPPAAKPSLLHPKDAGTAGMEEFRKVPWALKILVVGIPSPASFLRVTPPMNDITLCRVDLQELAYVQEIKVKREEIKRHNTALAVCSFCHS